METSEKTDSQIKSSAEGKRIKFNTAEPPPEIIKVINEQRLPQTAIEGWLAVPSINPPPTIDYQYEKSKKMVKLMHSGFLNHFWEIKF